MSSSQKPKSNNIDDDVDDLDDLIGQFTPQPVKTPGLSVDRSQSPLSSPSPPAAASSSSSASKLPYDAFSDEFATEFAKGIEHLLLSEKGGDSVDETMSEEDREKEKALKAIWDSLLAEPGAVGADGNKPSTSSSSSQVPPPNSTTQDSFQDRIKMAMDKLKESESTLKADSGPAEIESLLSELGKFGEGGEGDDDELQGILESMMSQLMSKEVLYEPLKDLHDKFPAYLTEKSSKLSSEGRQKYQSQYDCVTKIISVFESANYSEDDQDISLQIVTLMNEMQSYGAPPAEIMGELPPGLNLGTDGLPQLPEGCVVM